MTQTYTPGPWEAASPGDYDTDGIGVFARNPGGLRYYIASVRYMGTAPKMGAEPNARLIAAAPELLAALEDAEFLLRKAGQIAGPMQDSFQRSATDARAAIAKATA